MNAFKKLYKYLKKKLSKTKRSSGEESSMRTVIGSSEQVSDLGTRRSSTLRSTTDDLGRKNSKERVQKPTERELKRSLSTKKKTPKGGSLEKLSGSAEKVSSHETVQKMPSMERLQKNSSYEKVQKVSSKEAEKPSPQKNPKCSAEKISDEMKTAEEKKSEKKRKVKRPTTKAADQDQQDEKTDFEQVAAPSKPAFANKKRKGRSIEQMMKVKYLDLAPTAESPPSDHYSPNSSPQGGTHTSSTSGSGGSEFLSEKQ